MDVNDQFDRDMAEATRLTGLGLLNEATALIQRALKGSQTIEAAANAQEPAKGAPQSLAHDAQKTVLSGLLETFKTSAGALPQLLRKSLKHRLPRPSEIAPTEGEFISRTFNAAAGNRAYRLYIPRRRRSGARPLIVMLHGCAQSPEDFAAGTRMNAVAEQHGCFVAYPEQTAAANSSRCWNWFKQGHQRRDQGEPSLIAGITRQIAEDFGIDQSRIYIAGLSAGGAAAAVASESYPDLYAALGVHSGLACGVASDLPSALAAMGGHHSPSRTGLERQANGPQVPTIVFHGDRDTTVHPRNGAEVVARAKVRADLQTSVEKGTAPQGHPFTRTVERDSRGRGILEHWVIHGAGHAWSGGSPAGSFTDPEGPDASREMVRFFLEHTRRHTQEK